LFDETILPFVYQPITWSKRSRLKRQKQYLILLLALKVYTYSIRGWWLVDWFSL